jgi:cytochrome c peroxidase
MLRGVYSSPPYLHNGAARTLEEIWTRFNLYQGHGTTHDLTRGQLNDLVAFLRTL